MAADYVGWGIGIAGIVAATGVAIWAGLRQGPKADVRIDGVVLMYLSLNDGDNTFKARITNHGSAIGEIARTEVQATLDGSALTAKIGGKDVVGTIATSESKELWLDVVLPEPTGMDIHDGRKRLRVTVTLHPAKGKVIRSSFTFSRDPGYGFVPSTTP
ncbi:hypothetical protein [Ottowia thiooxydans]|uniref:Uncharacterized protein n=1 Tax=Ottowia thiooxydans TaxID=219182 RepID=A0ABV2Q1R7_9BURK